MPDTQDQSQNKVPSEVEQRVQTMLGVPPRDPNKPAEPTAQPAVEPAAITATTNDVAEQRVQTMLGVPPRDPNKSANPPAEQPAEPATVQLVSNTQNEPTGPPPLSPGSTISPAAPDISPPMDTSGQIFDNLPGKEQDDQTPAIKTSAHENQLLTQIPAPPKPQAKSAKRKGFFKAWLGTPKKRWLTFGSVVVVMLFSLVLPQSRYFWLNSFGVRSSASVTILDESTKLPLRNVQIKLANATGTTNGDGQVKLEHIKLGRTKLVIEKRAFASVNQSVTIGWGSNPLGNFNIKPIGDQYAFLVKDWLSGKTVSKAEAVTEGGASAFSDNAGKILLTLDPSEIKDDMTVTVKATGYRNEPVKLGVTNKDEQPVNMVLARKQVFISNRSGRYDLYTVDLDGKNEKLVLHATGLERDDIVLVPHPTDEIAALVSSRVNARNTDGYLMNTLTLVNTADNLTLQVAQSEQIQIIGWSGSHLIYVKIAAGSSASDSNRYRLVSYDYKTTDSIEIAKANNFNDVILIGSNIYYATSTDSNSGSGLQMSNVSGSNKKTILDKEVWNVFRTSYDTLDLSLKDEWYEYKIGGSDPVKLNESPANPKSRVYINNPDNSHSLWVEQRDGKGVLISYDTSAGTDKVLQTKAGIAYPVRWLNSTTLIYRVNTETETADFVMSTTGGEAHKIKDVYNTRGIDRWYYY